MEKDDERHIKNGNPELVSTREEVMDLVSYYAQGSMSSHSDSDQPLSEDFAVLYTDEIRSVLPAVKHTYKTPKVVLGVSEEFPIAFDLLN